MRKVVALSFGLIMALSTANSVLADPVCVAGTVNTIANTSCTIGDEIFSFGNVTVRDDSGSGMTPADFLFSPDASDPNQPGFVLSGVITATTTDPLQLFVDQLGLGTVGLQTVSGQPQIKDLHATINGTATAAGGGVADIFAKFGQSNGADSAAAEPGIISPFPCLGPSCTAQGNFASPQPMTTGFVDYGFQVGNGTGSTARAISATFYVSETPAPVAELSSAFLLGSGVLGAGLIGWKTRRE